MENNASCPSLSAGVGVRARGIPISSRPHRLTVSRIFQRTCAALPPKAHRRRGDIRYRPEMPVSFCEHSATSFQPPAGQAQLPPVIVIARLIAHGKHGVAYAGGAADRLAARIVQLARRSVRHPGWVSNIQSLRGLPIRIQIADSECETRSSHHPAASFRHQSHVWTDRPTGGWPAHNPAEPRAHHDVNRHCRHHHRHQSR